ncbi:MAG: hypothetical protein ACOC44_04230 [Promethearchaeia archaeon]
MNSAPDSVQRLMYCSAATTLGSSLENSASALQLMISAIFIPHSQTATNIRISFSFSVSTIAYLSFVIFFT